MTGASESAAAPRRGARRVLSAVLFFPRGGSAHTARGLAQELPDHGWQVRLVAGSRPDLGPDADAAAFYSGIDVYPVRLSESIDEVEPAGEHGPSAPMHPSYEDRPGAADRVFASLDDRQFELQVKCWRRALDAGGAGRADLLHLHHLTPLNDAAIRTQPQVPVVGQLHGTELLMLEQIADGPPPSWRYAERWAERIRGWANSAHRLVVAPGGLQRAAQLLELPESKLVALPNGFRPDKFRPFPVDRGEHWRRNLVEEPQGALPGGPPGSVSYRDADLAPLREGVILTCIGRFTEVKRVPLLIRAFADAQERFEQPAALVLIGGYPGEHEGEHPAEVAAAERARNVFLAGWHSHHALPAFLNASDAIVLASVREQFGQVLVEAMACGLPAIAVESFGPRGIVEDGRTGWLVPGDDRRALAAAMVECVNNDDERQRRGKLARESALRQFSWSGIAARLAACFEEVVQEDAQ